MEGSSNNTITLNGLRGGTTYSITVRAYQQLLGPASSTISVFTHCQHEGILICYYKSKEVNFYIIGIYLSYNGNCYPNGSYFWDSRVNSVTSPVSCVLPGTSLTTGQWVRVADPDDPVECNNNNDNDAFNCTKVTAPYASISIYFPPNQGLPADKEGFYKCCLPTDCSTATNIIFANIFSKGRLHSLINSLILF